MASLNINNLDREVRELPSLSVVVSQLLTLLQRDDVAMVELMEAIGRDQGLAVRILRIANSPFYGLSTHIASLNDAGAMLGVHTLYSIVTAAGIMGQFPPTEDQSFDRLSFWKHAIGVGVCAQVLARHGGLDVEVAFTSGLLHDIGKLVMAAYFESDFSQVLAYRDQHDCLLRDAEQAVLGFDHTVIGARVARHWKLPEPVTNAIKHHHTLLSVVSPLSELVHVADILCRALDIGHGGDDLIPVLNMAAMKRLGLDWMLLANCLDEIEKLNRFSDLLIA
ncbi:MAG TPA: HDOD domain-containing protein [Gammaproteobacteria bacterium]|nr:HDOD domain-containing protein [Gammaproteobacteria bacterium]